MKFSLAFLAVFASAVLADTHYSCTCHNGDSYNWRITSPACSTFATDNSADVSYNTESGRCTSASGNLIGGNEWEEACKKIATAGFDCADGQGKCYATTDAIKGWCD